MLVALLERLREGPESIEPPLSSDRYFKRFLNESDVMEFLFNII